MNGLLCYINLANPGSCQFSENLDGNVTRLWLRIRSALCGSVIPNPHLMKWMSTAGTFTRYSRQKVSIGSQFKQHL